MLSPPSPAVRAEISISLVPGTAALTPTAEPHPAIFIRAARFTAFVFIVPLLVNDTLLVPEVNVHDDEVEDPAVRISVFVRPVIVRVLPEAGSAEKVPVRLAATGGLAVNVTPSTVSVELPLTLDELRVPTTPVIGVAVVPLPRLALQSLVIFDFLALDAADANGSGVNSSVARTCGPDAPAARAAS
jgi:hypothetical protein